MTSRTRRTLAAALGLTATAAMALVGAPAFSAPTEPEPLKILLTNDDGWNAPGITAVHKALEAAGHDVTMVAPASNQSGTGGRISHGTKEITHPTEDIYTIDGTPADSVEFGLKTVFADEAPDLIVSGTNTGQNIAAATVHSGTVGAAVTALNDRIPAIAVSTEVTDDAAPYDDTADFVVKLIDELEDRGGKKNLLPSGVGLNVNYPIVDGGGEPKDVELTNTGNGFFDATVEGQLPKVGDTSTVEVGASTDAEETVDDADSTALAEDKVAITPIAGSYDAEKASGKFESLANALD